MNFRPADAGKEGSDVEAGIETDAKAVVGAAGIDTDAKAVTGAAMGAMDEAGEIAVLGAVAAAVADPNAGSSAEAR